MGLPTVGHNENGYRQYREALRIYFAVASHSGVGSAMERAELSRLDAARGA